MFAKINHLAIVSENYAALAKFYEGVFGMKDHFGFKVESLAALKADIETISANPHLRPVDVGVGREGRNRLDIFKRTCPLGAFRMADSDGVLIDAAE